MFKSLKDEWVLLAILLSLIVILPISTIISFIFVSGGETWIHLKSTVLNNYIINSFFIAFVVFLLTIIVGTITAWIITIYTFPFRKYIQWLLVLPLAIPSYALCYVYSDIFGFNGYFNNL